MTRYTIGLLITLALGLLPAPFAAEAQPAVRVPRIGMLSFFAPPSTPDWKQDSPFLQALRELGYVEGRTITIEFRWAEQRADRLPALAADLVRLGIDVMVTYGTPATRAAKHATTTIPIIGVFAVDPVAEDFVATLARPGGNITGVGGLVPELNGKLLELLKEAVPGMIRVAVFADPRHPELRQMVEETTRAAQALGVQPHVLEVRGSAEFEHAFEDATREGAGALLLLPGLLFSRYQRQLAALAVKSHLPAIYWSRAFAEVGGLMAYGPRWPDLWRRAAALVDKILKGAKPADLPVEQPTTFELVIHRASRDS